MQPTAGLQGTWTALPELPHPLHPSARTHPACTHVARRRCRCCRSLGQFAAMPLEPLTTLQTYMPRPACPPRGPQALPLLQKEFPIERARMRLKLTAPLECQQELEQLLQRCEADVQSIEVGPGVCNVVAQVGRHGG